MKPYSGQVAPASSFAAVAPSDSTDLPTRPRFLIIGTAGNLTVIGTNGVQTTIPVPAGVIAISPTRIYATGTTAANIVACW